MLLKLRGAVDFLVLLPSTCAVVAAAAAAAAAGADTDADADMVVEFKCVKQIFFKQRVLFGHKTKCGSNLSNLILVKLFQIIRNELSATL